MSLERKFAGYVLAETLHCNELLSLAERVQKDFTAIYEKPTRFFFQYTDEEPIHSDELKEIYSRNDLFPRSFESYIYFWGRGIGPLFELLITNVQNRKLFWVINDDFESKKFSELNAEIELQKFILIDQ